MANTLIANYDAECAVIGSILIDSYVYDIIGGFVEVMDFGFTKTQVIYSAIVGMRKANKPIDTMTISWWLTAMHKLRTIGGDAAITEMVAAVPTYIHAPYYAAEVVKHSISRLIVECAQSITKSAYNDDGIAALEILQRYEHAIEQKKMCYDALLALQKDSQTLFDHGDYDEKQV